jgi:glyoxalase family protein
VLGFTELRADDWEARGETRGGRIVFEQSDVRGTPGAGTVHHVAWAVLEAEIAGWRDHVAASGARPTPVIDRFWFESVYFREPSGILYELATLDGAGFDADETPNALGEKLVLPPFLEAKRAQIEPRLTPLPDPTVWRPQTASAPSTTTTTTGADR